MSGRDPARLLGRSRRACPGPADRNWWLAIWCKTQIVRVFLPPFESRLLTVNAQAQIILVSGSHLARPQHSSRAVFKPQERLHIIVKPASRHENRNFRRHLLAPQTRHEA